MEIEEDWVSLPQLMRYNPKLGLRGSSTSKFQHASFLKLGFQIPRRFAPGINSINASNPTSLHLEDNSTKKLQLTKFLKFKSHYFVSLMLPRR
jgi:hypothetical protein